MYKLSLKIPLNPNPLTAIGVEHFRKGINPIHPSSYLEMSYIVRYVITSDKSTLFGRKWKQRQM